MAKTKQYSERIQVVVTPEDGKRIKQLADRANLSLSGYCKQLILASINTQEDTTTQLLPIDTTQTTTLDTTYVNNEYNNLWEAINTLTKENQAIRDEVSKLDSMVTTLATTLVTTASKVEPEHITDENSIQLLPTILPINITAQTQSQQDIEAINTTQDSNLVTTALEPGTILTIKQLADRLGKTLKEKQTLPATLTTVGGTKKPKEATITAYTASKDPDGYSWLPNDENREEWVRQ